MSYVCERPLGADECVELLGGPVSMTLSGEAGEATLKIGSFDIPDGVGGEYEVYSDTSFGVTLEGAQTRSASGITMRVYYSGNANPPTHMSVDKLETEKLGWDSIPPLYIGSVGYDVATALNMICAWVSQETGATGAPEFDTASAEDTSITPVGPTPDQPIHAS